MCELTFSNLGKMNKAYFVNQAIINANSNNNDGIGYMQDGKIWKSKLSGAFINNLGTLAGDALSDESPLAFHVRYATNRALNEDCHSHPFSGDKLLLMHNGKLQKKDYSLLPQGKVDSQVFTEEMEAELVKTPDIPIVDLLQKVMDDWCGKFAFMIYDLRDSNYYIIRGASADLHWTTVNDKLVVNTLKSDLLKGTHILRQLHQLTYNEDLKIEEIKEVAKDSIFKFSTENGDLELVGELVENRPPLTTGRGWTEDAYGTYYPANRLGSAMAGETTQIEPISGKLKRWLDYHGMTLLELNELSNVIMGTSLLKLNNDDLRCLYADVLSVLDGKTMPFPLEQWKALVKLGYANWAYSQNNFSFPWMLNTSLNVTDMFNSVNAEIERRKIEREKIKTP